MGSLLTYVQLLKKLDLPFCTFVVDKNGVFRYLSKHLKELLCIKYRNQTYSKSLLDVLENKDDFHMLYATLSTQDSITMQEFNFITEKKDVVGELHCKAIQNKKTGIFLGVAGFIIDVTEVSRRSLLLEKMPLGYYLVIKKQKKDLIQDCNERFAKIFGYDTQGELNNTDIKRLLKPESDYEILMRNIEEQDGKAIIGLCLDIVKKDGSSARIELNCRKYNENGKIGHFGIIRDVTEESINNKILNDVTQQISFLLHSYSSFMLSTKLRIKAILDTNSYDPFLPFINKEGMGITNDLKPIFRPHISKLLDSIRLMFINELAEKDTQASYKDMFNEFMKYWKQVESSYVDVPLLRLIAFRSIKNIPTHSTDHIDKEHVRTIITTLRTILLMCNQYTGWRVYDEIVELEPVTSRLGEFITSRIYPTFISTKLNLKSIVDSVRMNIEEFALMRGVELIFKLDPEYKNVYLESKERDIIRALSNVLHNAIKYSWMKKREGKPYVTVSLIVRKGHTVVLGFENYGMPMKPEEITAKLKFRQRFRGEYSTDLGRPGTGIGLNDTISVVEAHKGTISIDSEPASGFVNHSYSTQPYKTTVKIKLPIFMEVK